MIVVDNGSVDDSKTTAERLGARVLERPDLGIGALRNEGARVAAGALLAFVDADHEVAPEWTAAAVESFREASVAAAGADCVPPTSSNWVQRAYDSFRRHGACSRDVEWLGSGNMVVRADAFTSVGGFDETLQTCEDVDLCRRLRRVGYRVVADDALKNIHHGDPSRLSQVFRGERWRGRDNLRVSFRKPWTLRTIASAMFPVLTLLGVTTAITAQAVLDAPLLAIVAGGMAIAPTLVRFLRARGALSSVKDAAAVLAVSAAYEAGRAAAIASPAGYSVRRGQR